MSAVLFGSISTIADTSELQRDAFNQAFAVHGLGWHWNREDYASTLQQSGGQQRIAEYAASVGASVDAQAVHQTKTEIFQSSLSTSAIAPRAGVVETIQEAKKHGVKVALVTTTSATNVAALAEALRSNLQFADFDIVVDSSSVDRPKPDNAAYTFALASLGESASDCVAIEDNVGGLHAATAAQVKCVAFPNENTVGHDFGKAERVADRLDFQLLQQIIASKA